MGVTAEGMTIEVARELVSNQLLWPLVRAFLWDFAPSIHASWLDGLQVSGLVHDFVRSEVQRPNPSPRVKRYILDSLGVEPCFHTFPKEDFSRILLLDGATLESIAKWLGALACAGGLRRVTDGATVRELKASLPGVYPEVFGYTMYFNVAAKDAETAKTPEDIVATGFKMLFSQFAGLPESLVARIKFKLPKSLCELCVPCGKAKSVVSGSVVSKLLKLKFPEAYELCCS